MGWGSGNKRAVAALRASDLRDLNPSHIVNNTIEKRSTKTKRDLRIPLKIPALQILERYGFRLPIISDQKINENIQKVCDLAGMDKQVAQNLRVMILRRGYTC
jgi:integrase